MTLIRVHGEKHRIVGYYVATIEGRPIVGQKHYGARFPREQAERVLEHLRIIDPARFAEATLAEDGQ